jgi:hypothetical protein
VIARLAGAAARRPGVTGAVLVLLGVWITGVAIAYTSGVLVSMIRQVGAEVLGLFS